MTDPVTPEHRVRQQPARQETEKAERRMHRIVVKEAEMSMIFRCPSAQDGRNGAGRIAELGFDPVPDRQKVRGEMVLFHNFPAECINEYVKIKLFHVFHRYPEPAAA